MQLTLTALFLALLAIISSPDAQAANVKIGAIPDLSAYAHSSNDGCDPNPGKCTLVDQSGSMEPWECRDSKTGNIRCYADVKYANGTNMRVWGGCFDSYSDCWWNGDGAVDPCED